MLSSLGGALKGFIRCTSSGSGSFKRCTSSAGSSF
jgi:hypothetical protein